MAAPNVIVYFEIGHEAFLRDEPTPEGYTHDWKVYVRGADGAQIHHFVEKVIFFLHPTFPNPRRVVKYPPYAIEESGYGGFEIPIFVHFKNTKLVQYEYDLSLQPVGSSTRICRSVVKECYIVKPTEEFRRLLIRGGGIGTGVVKSFHRSENEESGVNPLPSKTAEPGNDKAAEEPTDRHKAGPSNEKQRDEKCKICQEKVRSEDKDGDKSHENRSKDIHKTGSSSPSLFSIREYVAKYEGTKKPDATKEQPCSKYETSMNAKKDKAEDEKEKREKKFTEEKAGKDSDGIASIFKEGVTEKERKAKQEVEKREETSRSAERPKEKVGESIKCKHEHKEKYEIRKDKEGKKTKKKGERKENEDNRLNRALERSRSQGTAKDSDSNSSGSDDTTVQPTESSSSSDADGSIESMEQSSSSSTAKVSTDSTEQSSSSSATGDTAAETTDGSSSSPIADDFPTEGSSSSSAPDDTIVDTSEGSSSSSAQEDTKAEPSEQSSSSSSAPEDDHRIKKWKHSDRDDSGEPQEKVPKASLSAPRRGKRTDYGFERKDQDSPGSSSREVPTASLTPPRRCKRTDDGFERKDQDSPGSSSRETSATDTASPRSSTDSCSSSSSLDEEQVRIKKLRKLQRKMLTLRGDEDFFQKVVDVIADAGSFQVSEESFEFDLFKLDPETVKRLQDVMSEAGL